tara:strand:- start:16192 stop:17367 length:1176 start_codon:yes stop_codon:yes gene_type:complete
MTIIIISLGIFISILICIELAYLIIPNSPLVIIPIKSEILDSSDKKIKYSCTFKIINTSKYKEIMIPDINISPELINNRYRHKLDYEFQISIIESKYKNNYWDTQIIPNLSSITIKIDLSLFNSRLINLTSINDIWLKVLWSNYGPFGRLNREDCYLITNPYENLKSNTINIDNINSNSNYEVFTVKTHLLGVFDDPVKTIENYTKDFLKPGDIITIGESPLAIMQGQYNNYQNINYNIITRLLCRGFNPKSSLATACGMQSLINEVGSSRVIISLIIGKLFKFIGIKGVFYRLSGYQSSLIDDISGTIPPYDKTIVLGPKNINSFCKSIKENLNIDIAIVDVNDLGKVKILSSNKECDRNIVYQALSNNPAGNSNEKTPIVIIRPKKINK